MLMKKQKRKQLDELFLRRYPHHCGKKSREFSKGIEVTNKKENN